MTRALRALASVEDREADGLPVEIRAAIARHWLRRTRSEHRVGRAFAALATILEAQGVPRTLTRLARLSAADEARHSDLCAALAARYGVGPVNLGDLGEVELPRFGVGDAQFETTLTVAGTCCINETIATAWIEACLTDSTLSKLASAAHLAHAADEARHAQLGWAYLSSRAMTSSTRTDLARCLPRLLAANLPYWERPDPDLPTEGVPGHGHLAHSATLAVIHSAVRELVLPGFAHVGIDTRAALAWFGKRS